MPTTEKPEGNVRPTIVLDVDAWHRLMARQKLTSDAEVAERLGMSAVTVWRVQTGQREVGERFIAAVLARIPGAKFDRLFTVRTGGDK